MDSCVRVVAERARCSVRDKRKNDKIRLFYDYFIYPRFSSLVSRFILFFSSSPIYTEKSNSLTTQLALSVDVAKFMVRQISMIPVRNG